MSELYYTKFTLPDDIAINSPSRTTVHKYNKRLYYILRLNRPYEKYCLIHSSVVSVILSSLIIIISN